MKRLCFLLLCLFLLMGIYGCGNNKNEDFKYVVEDVIVSSGKYELEGKLTIPIDKKTVPAVVLVHGSGSLDMDSSVNSLKPFENIAEGLAKKGIASIRYDKVTYAYLEEVAADFYFTIADETINDALSAIDILKDDERVDSENIFILGHSFGGQLAPVILNRDDGIKGAIMLAATFEHFLDVLMKQYKKQSEEMYNQYYPYYEFIRNLKEPVNGQENYQYFGGYQYYWVDYNLLDIEMETVDASNNHPLLIMQGGLDLQVEPKTLDLYKELLKDSDNVVYKLYEDLNHCFVDGKDETIYNAYKRKKAIPEIVFTDIHDFIESNK